MSGNPRQPFPVSELRAMQNEASTRELNSPLVFALSEKPSFSSTERVRVRAYDQCCVLQKQLSPVALLSLLVPELWRGLNISAKNVELAIILHDLCLSVQVAPF